MKFKFLLIVILIAVITALPFCSAAEKKEYIAFIQAETGSQTLLVADKNGVLQKVFSGKEIVMFPCANHLLYFSERQLFEYDPLIGRGRRLAVLEEENIYIQELSGEVNQALIIAQTLSGFNYYVLDFSDGDVRRTPRPKSASFTSASTSKISSRSPDEKKTVTVKRLSKSRFELSVEAEDDFSKKSSWVLPRDLTSLPELPVWSPDSLKLAFFGKKQNGYEGFYSLYVLELESRKLRLVQEQVFGKDFFNELGSGGFRPDWSADGKYLVFQYLPYALPTESVLLKYEPTTGAKYQITKSRGENQYPRWAPSGDSLFFLSNRGGDQFQLYLIGANGGEAKRVSPDKGFTETAEWFQAEVR